MGTLWLDRHRRPTGRARRLHALGAMDKCRVTGLLLADQGVRLEGRAIRRDWIAPGAPAIPLSVPTLLGSADQRRSQALTTPNKR
jgi:hypothetical protein